MATVDLVMPKMGESIMEATILKWHKQPGDQVKMDETVLEIATDKVDSEVPSTAEGVIAEVLFNVNDVVPVGTVIARVKTGAAESNNGTQPSSVPVQTKDVPIQEESFQEPVSTASHHYTAAASQGQVNGSRFYSPLVLNIAAQEGVSMSELEKIAGTGNEGRVTKRDILQFVHDKRSGKAEISRPAGQRQEQQQNMVIPMEKVEPSREVAAYTGNVEVIEMDRMRKMIAEHMVRSKHTSPHVTSFTEADVTNLVMWRNKVKKEFEKRENTKITFTPLFIEAIVLFIKKFPFINSSL